MQKRTLIIMMVTLFAAFCLAGTAMAANTATIKSDKPIIPKSDCGHAGNITIQLDNGTKMHEGDVLRFKLDDGSTVCGNINYFLKLATTGAEVIANNGTDPIQTSENTLGSVMTIVNGVAVAPGAVIVDDGTSSAGTVMVGFLVQATDGSAYVTVTLAVRAMTGTTSPATLFKTQSDSTSNLSVVITTSGASETFDIHLFDGNQQAGFFFEPSQPSAAPTIYDDEASDNQSSLAPYTFAAVTNEATVVDYADNVLCIDTANFSSSLDHAIPESRPWNNQSTYQLSFLGDYIIAQLVAAVEYGAKNVCKDATCNYVAIGSKVDQQGVVTKATGLFDYGNYSTAGPSGSPGDRWTGSGYCSAGSVGNGILIYKDGDTFQSGDQYQVTLTLRVGSAANKDKAIWSSGAVADYWTSSNEPLNCSNAASGSLTSGGGAYAFGGATGLDETILKKSYTVTASEAAQNAIMLDLPVIQLGGTSSDLTKVSAGEKVYVDVVISKLPCGGSIINETFCLAELVNTCPISTTVAIDGIVFIGDRQLTRVLHGYLGRLSTNFVGYQTVASNQLFFPYVPALNDADFFTGLCVAVTGTADVKLTVLLKDSAGGSATATVTGIGTGTQYVNVLDNLTLTDGATPLDPTKTMTVTVTAGK